MGTTRRAARFEAMREESRERIVRAALDRFARDGYAGASVRAIAEEAGVSPGLLYHYFDGKRGVLRAIFARSMERVARTFEGAGEGSTAAERLDGLVHAAFEAVGRELPFWRLTYALRMQPGVLEDLAAEQAAWTEQIRGRLEALLRELGSRDPAVDARALFAAIDGAAQHYAMDPSGYPVEAVAAAIVRRFLPFPGADPVSEEEAR